MDGYGWNNVWLHGYDMYGLWVDCQPPRSRIDHHSIIAHPEDNVCCHFVIISYNVHVVNIQRRQDRMMWCEIGRKASTIPVQGTLGIKDQEAETPPEGKLFAVSFRCLKCELSEICRCMACMHISLNFREWL